MKISRKTVIGLSCLFLIIVFCVSSFSYSYAQFSGKEEIELLSMKDGAQGKLTYFGKCKGVLKGQVKLSGLTPNHLYMLCLNGKPGKPGNKLLIDKYEPYRNGGKVDFARFRTDAKGRATKNFTLSLTPGKYDVKFFVKDTSGFRCVLQEHDLKFTIAP
ncbi:MAG: hypothetical protein K8T10_16075 [Candidatus Eremiobacteraeota bacterium]|nr:hypothetical protein [Candidatus Eremiobacteraeota bacterium]